MKHIFKILFVLLVITILFPKVVFAEEKTISIHLFYGEGCPHCAKEEEFLEKYQEENPYIKVYKYEVWNDFSNRNIWMNIQKVLKKKASGVPYTVIGNRVLTGYREIQTDKDIKYLVDYYQKNNYRDIVGEEIGLVEKNEDIILEEEKLSSETVHIPLIGDINPKSFSLPILAIVIGFIDGFNPCAMWVLLFLITMLIGMKDKKRMWILGLTFLITSSLVYLLFMVAWLNLAIFITKIFYIRMLIAFVAIGVGSYNLRNYFKKSESGCEVVGDKKRKNIIGQIKNITTQNKFALALIGVIALAISVNIIELLCSAGLPLMFTNILALNNLTNIQYSIYILLYILFFLLDDIVIFTIAMISFKVTGISTKYTKYSHLIGGIVMILIGLLLLFKPEILMFNF